MSLELQKDEDRRWMRAALALASRGAGRSTPNPAVGCVIVNGNVVVGRGWTQQGGRPHAEAVALAQAGDAARGATLYTTLEPCTHVSARGPDCTGQVIAAGVARVVSALHDPDPRTHAEGHRRLAAAGIDVTPDFCAEDAAAINPGFHMRLSCGRPAVTLKLAQSLDGCVALADGRSHWITGDLARAHGHLERSRHDAILVGRGTWETDSPRLDVRLPGLEMHSPERFVVSSQLPEGLTGDLSDILQLFQTKGFLTIMVEGGARLATSFLKADLVDRLLLYTAPVVIGAGMRLGDIGLGSLAEAHGCWQQSDSRALGSDRLDVYVRTRKG